MKHHNALDTLEVANLTPVFSVLLLDDDPDWLDATPEVLRLSIADFAPGIEPVVEIADSTAAADEKLSQRQFDAVLCDVSLSSTRRFGIAESQGDEWLLSRAEQIGPAAIKAIVTAFPQRIRDPLALEKRGILTVRKSTKEDEEMLFARVLDAAKAKASGKEGGEAPVPKNAEEPRLDIAFGQEIASSAAHLFLEWLESRPNQWRKVVLVGNRELSVKELSDEVLRRTSIGQRIVKIFILHLRSRIGIGER